MNTFDLFLAYVNSGCAWAVALASMLDPTSALYGLLAGTYGTAAAAVSRNDHHLLTRCYVASALLHALIAVCHHMQI